MYHGHRVAGDPIRATEATTESMERRVTMTSEAKAVQGPGRLMRIEDIADRLNCSRSMAHKLVATGAIPGLHIGRAVRVRPEDLEAYIAGAVRDA